MRHLLVICLGSLLTWSALATATAQPPGSYPGSSGARRDRDLKELTEALKQAMKDPDPAVRLLAAQSLQHMAEPEQVESVMIELLMADDGQARKIAAQELGDMGKYSVRGLIRALHAEDRDLRANAAYVLGKIGRPAQEALPVLVKGLKEKDLEVRRRMAFAINRIILEEFSSSGPPGMPGAPGAPPGMPGPGGNFPGGPGLRPGGLGGPGWPGGGPGSSSEVRPTYDPGVLLPKGLEK